MKVYINTKDLPIISLKDIPIKNRTYMYYICEKCGELKEKRLYTNKENTCICRECTFKETSEKKYQGKNPGYIKMQESMIKKYGTTSTAQFIKHRRINTKKRKKTLLERYGVDNPAKIDFVKQKIRETNIERYGFSTASQHPNVKKKQKETMIKKYGSSSNFPGPIASHNKFLSQRNTECYENNLIWLDQESFRGKYDNGPINYHFKCLKCDNEFTSNFHSGFPVCRICTPIHIQFSKAEKEIVDHIKTFYDGTIIENDRKVLNGLELDIYLPDLNLAIEYNGTYWHGYRSDTKISLNEFKQRNEKKRLLCREKGIRLITIDEYDYTHNKDVIQKFLMNVILPKKIVYARKCEINHISNKDAKVFLNTYHVNGFRGGSTRLGLFNNGELLCVAIFAKHKKYKNECIRLAFKTGYIVLGGWEKIQKHFGEQFLHYVNLKYFEGENKTGCGYKFFLNKKLISRNRLQKKSLHKYLKNVNENISDFQNCLNNGGIAIFDLGNDIRIYNEKLCAFIY